MYQGPKFTSVLLPRATRPFGWDQTESYNVCRSILGLGHGVDAMRAAGYDLRLMDTGSPGGRSSPVPRSLLSHGGWVGTTTLRRGGPSSARPWRRCVRSGGREEETGAEGRFRSEGARLPEWPCRDPEATDKRAVAPDADYGVGPSGQGGLASTTAHAKIDPRKRAGARAYGQATRPPC